MQPVRYDPSVEMKQPDEDQITAQILESFTRLRTFTFDKLRHGVRDAHAKSHGVVKGELTVYPDLAEPLAQGVFRTPRRYPVIVRFSTAPGDILPDGVSAFRGMAIKIIGVEGRKILPELADAVTQDFLMINHPALPPGNVSAYLKAQLRMEKLAHAPEELQEGLTAVTRTGGRLLRKIGIDAAGVIGQGMPETNILGETFFTSAPARHGDYIARIAAVPVSESLQPLRGASIDASHDNALRDAVIAFFAHSSAAYELRVQLCTDLTAMPIEDASVRWPEEQSPYLPVARLDIPAQNSFSHERRVYADDLLTFNPWHTLPEHQPLGSVMRVRRPAYDQSSRDRHAKNARPRVEPTSIDELPD